ncbi:THAP domain-containing protein 1-like [Orbicella faveolata]|uniref:THAP domain-containing protein 1-like n=1 Tax=Orbicella faveolata TaxID=48498 RepID=UPI0009E1F75B|nr:THAP domain-containing protein 1-like [Orbicella faveolata]
MSLLRTCINYYDLVHLQITNSTRVCSVHFKEADFQTTLTGKRVLEKHAVPSIFCWSRSPRKRKSPTKREPPRARVRLFDVSVPSSPVTVTASTFGQASGEESSMEVQPELSSSPVVVDFPEPIYTVTVTGKYCCWYVHQIAVPKL